MQYILYLIKFHKKLITFNCKNKESNTIFKNIFMWTGGQTCLWILEEKKNLHLPGQVLRQLLKVLVWFISWDFVWILCMAMLVWHNCLVIYRLIRFCEINNKLSLLWLDCWPGIGDLHQTKTFTAKHKSTSVPCRYFRAHRYAKDELAFLSVCHFKAILYMQWLIRLIFITCCR